MIFDLSLSRILSETIKFNVFCLSGLNIPYLTLTEDATAMM